MYCDSEHSAPVNTFSFGYYANLSVVLEEYPEGGYEGAYFINGETLSIWVWDEMRSEWSDSSRAMQSVLDGLIDNPEIYQPDIKHGVKKNFMHISERVGEITFVNFKNNGTPLTATTTQSSIIMLFWDGDYWHITVSALRLEPYISREYTDYRFAKTQSFTDAPSIDRLRIDPGEKWSLEVPLLDTGDFLWMTAARFDGNGNFTNSKAGWAVPVCLTGDSAYTVSIESSNGSTFLNNNVNTLLIARVFYGAKEISDIIHPRAYFWKRNSDDKAGDILWNEAHQAVGASIEVGNIDVDRRATFMCEVYINGATMS